MGATRERFYAYRVTEVTGTQVGKTEVEREMCIEDNEREGCADRDADHLHDWQPRDDLSIAGTGGAFWRIQTFQCATCRQLNSVRWT